MIWHVIEASLICMLMGKMVQIKSIKNQKPRRTLKESYPERVLLWLKIRLMVIVGNLKFDVLQTYGCQGWAGGRVDWEFGIQFSHSVMSNSFVTPQTAACQASLSITNSWSLLKLMSIKLVMPSTISSSVIPFSCLQSFLASGSFPMNQFFPSGGQSIGASFQYQSFQWIFRADFL